MKFKWEFLFENMVAIQDVDLLQFCNYANLKIHEFYDGWVKYCIMETFVEGELTAQYLHILIMESQQ